MEIELSARQQEVWQLLESPEVSTVFAGGGAGGGKSWVGCLWQIHRRMSLPGTLGFIGRENATTLRDSTMKTYFELLGAMGYTSHHYNYNDQHKVVTYINGSEQHFRWMAYQPRDPDYNRMGSTGYTDAFVDEAPEVAERACDVLLGRLRYKHVEYDLTPAMLLTGNPGNSWIKHKFVMDGQGRMLDLPPHLARVLFTVRDNPDKEFAERYAKTLEQLDPYDRARLLDGDWNAQPRVDNPFAFAFEPARHVGGAVRREQDVHYFSIDFNVEPFSASMAHIWNDERGAHFHIVAEATIEHASIEAMAAWILGVCPYRHLIRITGDRGGYSRGIGTQGPVRMFDELQRALQISRAQIDVPPNPTHLVSRDDCNFVLANHPDFLVSPACRNVINDLRTVAVDGKGSIIKGDRHRMEQRADHLDTVRYLVNTYLGRWIKATRNDRAAVHAPHGAGRQPMPS